jgi:geranylgeranyl pyrophosphate synthase
MSVVLKAPWPQEVRLGILARLADSCGVDGLIQGEHDDIMAEGKDLSFEGIREIHRKKTSRLFELCMFAGSRIATGDPGIIEPLVSYGTSIGLAFQAIDDILDLTSTGETLGKTTGKDLLKDKATVVKALGLPGSRAWAEEMTDEAVSSIASLEGDAAKALKDIALWMLKRVM